MKFLVDRKSPSSVFVFVFFFKSRACWGDRIAVSKRFIFDQAIFRITDHSCIIQGACVYVQK